MAVFLLLLWLCSLLYLLDSFRKQKSAGLSNAGALCVEFSSLAAILLLWPFLP